MLHFNNMDIFEFNVNDNFDWEQARDYFKCISLTITFKVTKFTKLTKGWTA